MLKLATQTPAAWAQRALESAESFDALLLDHAHCEQKAAGAALRLGFRYPGEPALAATLSALAREELRHFEQVLAWLARRGLGFTRSRPSPYAARLRECVRSGARERLLDLLLCCAVIEARSSERLSLLADAAGDAKVFAPETARALARFYRNLVAAEERHGAQYLHLAQRCFDADTVQERWPAWLAHEARVLARAPHAPRLHDL